MLRRMGIMAATFAIAGAVAVATPASTPSTTLTVGDFLLLYAKSAHLTLPPDATPQTAQAALLAAKALPGIDLQLDKPLTQGDIVAIGRAAGLKIVSGTPTRTLERAEAELFLETFMKYSAPAGAAQDRIDATMTPPTSPPGNANTSKGKKKGRPFQSPTEPM